MKFFGLLSIFIFDNNTNLKNVGCTVITIEVKLLEILILVSYSCNIQFVLHLKKLIKAFVWRLHTHQKSQLEIYFHIIQKRGIFIIIKTRYICWKRLCNRWFKTLICKWPCIYWSISHSAENWISKSISYHIHRKRYGKELFLSQ